MSVRLWWKFSPNLMTPVPMIATFPPSPIAASLAPPSLPEPGATSNPARRARQQRPDSREHAQEYGRRHPEEQKVRPEADHPAEQPSQDDRDGVVHDVAGHRRHRAPAPLCDPAEVEAEEEGQCRVDAVEVQDAEAERRGEDRAGRRPALAQPRLHEAAKEHLLAETGEDTDPADGKPEHGGGSAGERPADRLEGAARFEPQDEGP